MGKVQLKNAINGSRKEVREVDSTENIDKTIDAICNWIQETIKACPSGRGDYAIPETTRALAELVSARAEIGGTSEELKIKKIDVQLGEHLMRQER